MHSKCLRQYYSGCYNHRVLVVTRIKTKLYLQQHSLLNSFTLFFISKHKPTQEHLQSPKRKRPAQMRSTPTILKETRLELDLH